MYVLNASGCLSVAFILPPKCGTRSVEVALRDSLGGRRVGNRHTVCPKECHRAGASVSLTRHPCDILVSWYHYANRGAKKQASMTFSRYLRGVFERDNGYLSYSTMQGAEHATFYIPFERGLQAGVNQFLCARGYPSVTIGRVGLSEGRRPWREYYTDELLSLVVDRYSGDFTRFGYEV